MSDAQKNLVMGIQARQESDGQLRDRFQEQTLMSQELVSQFAACQQKPPPIVELQQPRKSLKLS